jgi:hypothetical protein
MKSYISLICASAVLIFSSCEKEFILPSTTTTSEENPIEPLVPSTTTTTLVPRSTNLSPLFSTTAAFDEDHKPVTTITDAGIQGAHIGDPIKKMEDTYGTAFENYSAIDGAYQHYLWFFKKGIIASSEPNKSTMLDANAKIKSIELFEPFEGKTAKNIGIGSSKASVIAAYGKPTSSIAVDGDRYDTMYVKYNSKTGSVESIIIKN